MDDPLVEAMACVQHVNLHIGGLLVELLNHDDPASQEAQLRLGQHLGRSSWRVRPSWTGGASSPRRGS